MVVAVAMAVSYSLETFHTTLIGKNSKITFVHVVMLNALKSLKVPMAVRRVLVPYVSTKQRMPPVQ